MLNGYDNLGAEWAEALGRTASRYGRRRLAGSGCEGGAQNQKTRDQKSIDCHQTHPISSLAWWRSLL